MSFCLRPGHGDEGGQKKKKKKRTGTQLWNVHSDLHVVNLLASVYIIKFFPCCCLLTN